MAMELPLMEERESCLDTGVLPGGGGGGKGGQNYINKQD